TAERTDARSTKAKRLSSQGESRWTDATNPTSHRVQGPLLHCTMISPRSASTSEGIPEEHMTIEQQLNDTLKQAIKAKDHETADVVRMLKTKIMERRTAKGFAGEVDDALVLDTIGAYRKQLQKAVVEFEKAGDRGAQQAARLRAEIEFCE